jgi:hypothetical protein
MKKKIEEAVEGEPITETPKEPALVEVVKKPELLYIANNNTFVVEAPTDSVVTVYVNDVVFGVATSIGGVATVIGKELSETYQYLIK